MKSLLIILVTLGVLTAAGETTPRQQEIRQMIQEIRDAPEAERYQKMNRFKQMVREMNQEERKAAVDQLKASMSQEGSQVKMQETTRTQTRTQDGDGEMTQTRERERMQNLQNQQLQQQMQQRSQMQNQQQINRPTQSGAMPQGPGGNQAPKGPNR